MDDDGRDTDTDREARTELTLATAPEPKVEAASAAAKRREIQAILRDKTLTDLEKRLRVQNLMDGSSDAADDRSASGAAESLASSLLSPDVHGGDVTDGVLHRGTPPTTLASGDIKDKNDNGEEVAAPCVHYDRKCNIVAPCCGRVFGCRVCHDEMATCGPMNRFAIAEVVCKECNTRQSSKTNKCISCGISFAQYHCPKCNMWMALDKQPFHCDQCGFCRVGGRGNYRHCARCCMCISASTYASHSCMTDKYKNSCPVCREDMFSSRQSPLELPCGHAIHAHCFRNLAGFDHRCPICKKTAVSRESLATAWTARARDIERQPMPEDLARMVNIMCNDCERKDENRSWHFLGVQCLGCSSFNTVVES